MSKVTINKFKFLIDLYKKSEDLQAVLQKAKDALATDNITYFEVMLKKATVMSAKSTYLLRKSCNEMIVDKNIKNEAFTKAENINKMDFQLLDGGSVLLQLPPLINSRLMENPQKKDPYINFFNDVFFRKIKKFIIENDIKKYNQKITLYIINVVKEGTPKAWIPDIDNREYKNVINLVKQFFITDDSPEFLSIHLDTIEGPDERTLVYLIPDDRNVTENLLQKQDAKINKLENNKKSVA